MKVLLLDDGSRLAMQVASLRHSFASFERLRFASRAAAGAEAVLERATQQIIAWRGTAPPAPSPSSSRLWRTSATYCPAWGTADGAPVWLTGHGGMASVANAEPSFRWRSAGVQVAGLLVTLLGLTISAVGIYCVPRRLLF